MADDCPTTTAEATDSERRFVDSDAADADCVTADVAAVEALSTGVAVLDMPTGVLEIPDAEYAGSDDTDDEEENDSLPYPGYVEKAFFYFLQTTRPRNWCLQLITWPYPFCTH